MADIHSALVTLAWEEPLLAALRQALAPADVHLVNRRDRRAIATALKQVDVAFIDGDVDGRYLQAPRLQWVHCGHAGLDRSATPDILASGLQVTSAAGRSAPALAEHALLFMLALAFRMDRFYEAQRQHRWGISGQGSLQPLHGKTLGIVGLGHTGIELARRARAFDMRVVAYRRRNIASDRVDEIYSKDAGDSLDKVLGCSDFLVLALPLSDSTRHLIGARELARMRPGSYLINIARGGLVDEAALLQALGSQHLAGAAIDVAEEEPLPSGSPLWDAPNLLITPHFTPRLVDRDRRALELLLENLRRFRADQPLLNLLTPDDVCSPPGPGEHPRSALPGAFADASRVGRRLRHWLRRR